MNGTRDRAASRLAAILLLFALLVIVGSGASALRTPDLVPIAGLASAFFAARLLTIRLPQGDEVYVTIMVGLVGLALVDMPQLLLASLLAGFVDVVARHSQSTRSESIYRTFDALRGAAVLGALTPVQPFLLRLLSDGAATDAVILWSVAAGAAYALLDLLTAAVQQRVAGGMPVVQGMGTLIRPLGTVYVVHIAMAAVVLRLHPIPGGWPFPVAVLLTLILQNSFNLYLRIRRAYSETIGALARAAELDRPDDTGHARRVADLSVAVGRRIGLSSRDLERIGYAALLHDIGRIGDAGTPGTESHARRGAEIAASVPFLADVAPLILGPVSDDSASAPLGWRIVRACSRYDRMRAELGARAAIDVLAQQDFEDDGRVLEALEEVALARQSYLGEPA